MKNRRNGNLTARGGCRIHPKRSCAAESCADRLNSPEEINSDLVGYREPSQYPVNAYADLVPDLRLGDEDDKALNPGDAVSLP